MEEQLTFGVGCFFVGEIEQWQTPKTTLQNTERGKGIIFNEARVVKLYLFVRKYREVDGKTEPYIYIGKGNMVEYKGDKPITVINKLEHEIPANLYKEFTEKISLLN